MTKAKFFQAVCLLSLLTCSFNICIADDKSDDGEKWLWRARGSIRGGLDGAGIGNDGSVGGGISGSIGISGLGTGGIEGELIGVEGSGANKANCGHGGSVSGGHVGVGGGTGIGGAYGSSGVGVGTVPVGGPDTGGNVNGGYGYVGGSGSGGNGYVGGSGGGNGYGGGSGSGGWMVAPEWLGQPLFCTPMRCQSGACGGIELQLGFRFLSSNLSANQTNSNPAAHGIPNGTDGK